MIVEKVDTISKEVVFVYTTCPSIEQAKSMGLSAINEKLAACIDFWVIGSIYPWQGVIEDVEQYMLMFTTEKGLAEKLMKFVAGLHPYTTPMIARMDTAVMNPTYTFWVDTTLSSTEEYISEEEAVAEIKDVEDDQFRLK